MSEIRGIPFDAPLYEGDKEHHGGSFLNCQVAQVVFTIAGDITHLLPKELVPASNPAIGVVAIARYGVSNFGPYFEQYSGIQVRDARGDTGYYIPYIYLTSNDAALASGREVFGAPKKFAHIDLVRDGGLLLGILERPIGKRLITITVQPNMRMSAAIRQMVPARTICYSVRHLPPIADKGGVTQLVKWQTERTFRRDERNEEVLFTGPVSLTYDSASVIDPVHNLPVDRIILGSYEEFDSKVQALDIISGA
jgi:acetoacetate decarboxylase